MGQHPEAAWRWVPLSPARTTLMAALLAAIVIAGLGAHMSWQNVAVTQLHQQMEGLHKLNEEMAAAIKTSVGSMQQEVLKGMQQDVMRSKQELLSRLTASQVTWVRQQRGKQQHKHVLVKEQDLSHVGLVNAGCSSLANTKGLFLPKTSQLVAPVVVVAYDRAAYLARAMVSLLRHWVEDPANKQKFPLYISIDGAHQPTTSLALSLNYTAGVQVIRNERSPAHCHPSNGHCNLAMHYLMLVQLFFSCLKAPRLIFLEEDLEIAPDFFTYFAATAPLLDADRSLLCVSAWNDHGQRGRASNSTALYRTDVMPGLGWMLNAATAEELLPGWVNSTQYGGWDEYLRNACVRRGRQCVFPEVSRTHTFGKVGNSGGMFYEEHLQNMVLNKLRLNWSEMDLSFLQRENYTALMQSWLSHAVPLDANRSSQLGTYCDIKQRRVADEDQRDLLLTYSDHGQYQQYARQLAPMLGDISVGGKLPRASYNGTVMVRCRGRRLFLTAQSPPSAAVCQ